MERWTKSINLTYSFTFNIYTYIFVEVSLELMPERNNHFTEVNKDENMCRKFNRKGKRWKTN